MRLSQFNDPGIARSIVDDTSGVDTATTVPAPKAGCTERRVGLHPCTSVASPLELSRDPVDRAAIGIPEPAASSMLAQCVLTVHRKMEAPRKSGGEEGRH